MNRSGRAAAPPPTRVAGAEILSGDRAIWTILALGLLLRLPAIGVVGYAPDIAYWKSWLSYATEYGIGNIYHLDLPGQTYPPVLLYILWALGLLYRGIWPGAGDSTRLTAFVKIPAILGDLIAAFIVWRLLRAPSSDDRGAEATRAGRARLAAGVIALHPALIWLSSYWGQIDGLLGGLAVLGIALAWRGAGIRAGVVLALAVLTKPQGMIFVPLAGALLLRASGGRGFLRAAAAGAAIVVIACVPFIAAGDAGKLVRIYAGAGNVYPYLSVFAFNPWWCLSLILAGGVPRALPSDGIGIIAGVSYRMIGLILFAVATVWVLRRAWIAGTRERALRLLTLQWLFFFLLPTQMHERYIVPALLSLAIPAIFDRRLRIWYGMLSLAVLMNLLYVVSGHEIVHRMVRILSLDGVPPVAALIAVAARLVLLELRQGGVEGARS